MSHHPCFSFWMTWKICAVHYGQELPAHDWPLKPRFTRKDNPIDVCEKWDRLSHALPYLFLFCRGLVVGQMYLRQFLMAVLDPLFFCSFLAADVDLSTFILGRVFGCCAPCYQCKGQEEAKQVTCFFHFEVFRMMPLLRCFLIKIMSAPFVTYWTTALQCKTSNWSKIEG